MICSPVRAGSDQDSLTLAIFLCLWAGVRSTNTHRKPTEPYTKRTVNIFVKMQEQSEPMKSPTLTLSAPASLVNHSLQQANAMDSMIPEVLSFMKSCEWLKPGDLLIFCLKTSRGCSVTKTGKHSELSSPRFMSWGILLNGVCLTARITESRSSEGGCTLSDILIADCPEKYFLSPRAMERLLSSLYPEDRDRGSTAQKEQAHV